MNANFKDVLEYDSPLSGADVVNTENESKNCAFWQNFATFPVLNRSHVECNVGSGLAKSSWESNSLVSSLLACVIWELSDNVIINPLLMCLKKNPETLDEFRCYNLKDLKASCFLSKYILWRNQVKPNETSQWKWKLSFDSLTLILSSNIFEKRNSITIFIFSCLNQFGGEKS